MVVDVHCHLFNADDLPVRGFVRYVALHDAFAGSILADLVDRVVQGVAPGWAHDIGRLNALLGSTEGFESNLASETDPKRFDAEVDEIVAQLQVEDPEFVARVNDAMVENDGASPAEAGFEVISIGDVRRAVSWAKLFGRSRIDLAADYARAVNHEVSLCIPMLVDLGSGLGDRPKTTTRQQLELFEKLSRAAMCGVLPGIGPMQIHPFVGFDPLRELNERRANPVETPLSVVKDAIERYGFVGVKVYPQMGWRPSGNTARRGLSEADALKLNEIVDELARWCEERQVPITAHCNDSNYARDEYQGFGSADQWVQVLAAHPKLHLNLGHFGGAHADVTQYAWPSAIAQAFGNFDHLYGDVGCHRIDQGTVADTYLDVLKDMAAAPSTRKVPERIMFGTDWYMLAINPQADAFLANYRDLYLSVFGEAHTSKFMGDNARRFLGFDDANNLNAIRLFERYQKYAPGNIPAWLETS